jgi:hypothetical protein
MRRRKRRKKASSSRGSRLRICGRRRSRTE